MAALKDFVSQKLRPLPVIILADISGSMTADGKINSLNEAIKDMLGAFREMEEGYSQICLMCIAFGAGNASIHIDFQPVTSITWQPMIASGDTPMGSAFHLLTQILESRDEIPSRSYRPTIVLISDGQPTDQWTQPLQTLLASPRAGKAIRMAMGIGADADIQMLQQFIAAPEQRVFSASDARDIKKFFRYVTMSVTSRSRSLNPNEAPLLPPMVDDLDELEY